MQNFTPIGKALVEKSVGLIVQTKGKKNNKLLLVSRPILRMAGYGNKTATGCQVFVLGSSSSSSYSFIYDVTERMP